MTSLYWIKGPWQGKLAISSRPRGGDWLEDELHQFASGGATAVLSLLTRDEENELDLTAEGQFAVRAGLTFLSLPIPDLQVPSSPSEVAAVLEQVDGTLSSGNNAIIHCRQGVGRSGMIAACLLVMKGQTPDAAVRTVERARGVPIPETPQQRQWIDLFASTLAHAN